MWNLETGAEEHTLSVTAWSALADPDGAPCPPDDRTLKVWNLETGAEEQRCRVTRLEVRAVAVTRMDGAVSASDDSTLKVWNLETGRKNTLSVTRLWSARCRPRTDGAPCPPRMTAR
ncbi:MAG: hypothetical protein M9965_08630 [Anaerolineae bacterium]|nr:hypothetical protein [Anaerolineae bacterium]